MRASGAAAAAGRASALGAVTLPSAEAPLSYGRQQLSEADVLAVTAALTSDRLTQGPLVPAFEAELASATGAAAAVAVANGTLALELAYAALGVGPGARVVVPANTFLATATTAVRLGATVEFVDVEPATGNLDVDALERLFARDATPDLVVPVHFAGLPCDMQRLLELKRAFGFALVEDAAHALGARYRADGRWWRPGEHPEVEAATLSFHPVKAITTAEGGAVLTAHADLAHDVRLLRSHGVDAASPRGRDERYFAPMVALGTNARLSELHAALGRTQLARLNDFRAQRARLAACYRETLGTLGRGDVVPLCAGDATREHAWHLFVVHVDPSVRDELRERLAARGVGTQVHYHPVPYQPWFARRRSDRSFDAAERHARSAISLPLHPGLDPADVRGVCVTLVELLDEVAPR